MKNLVKDILNNCEDKSIKGIISFLVDSGDLSYVSDYHREIYFFYLEARKAQIPRIEAKKTTIELFNISTSTLKRILRKYKGSTL